jgi:Photosynthesis system II assembly factor YCF48
MRLVSGFAIVLLTVTLASAQPEPVAAHHIHGLSFDPREPGALLVATHTGLVRVRLGANPEWVGANRFDLMGFTALPGDPGTLYASGHPDLVTYRREGHGNLGLLVSRDGGRTWEGVALKGQTDFHALTYSLSGGGELFGWSVAEQTGLHRISAKTWAAERLPAQGLKDVLALAASHDLPGRVLAGTQAGLLLSQDRGMTWRPVAGIPRDAPVTAAAYSPAEKGRVYAYVARAGYGLMRSDDAGATWRPTDLAAKPNEPVIAIALGSASKVAVATTAASVSVSDDDGRLWRLVLDRGRVGKRAQTKEK